MRYNLLLIIFITFCISGFSFSQSSLHPNVILIITDDQGYGDLSCKGDLVNRVQSVYDLKY